MLEVLLCSVITILPDFLIRRLCRGKEFGREITLYSVWYELRYGITACLVLTVCLLTLILYFHPSTSNAVTFFRTVPILPESSGRVDEIYVGFRDKVKAGQKLFKLDSSEQEAALETAKKRVLEIDAALELAKTDMAGADAQDPGSAERLPAGGRRTRHQDRASEEKRLDRCAAGHREAAEHRRWQAGFGGCGDGQQAVGRGPDVVGAARAKSQRRGSACSGAGRTGQDDRLCRGGR